MTLQVVPTTRKPALERLVDDYLNHCRAPGVSPRTDSQYSFPLRQIFLPWCGQEGIEHIEDFDRRAADRFSATLLSHTKADGKPLSRYTVAAYTRPVRQLVTWERREGERVDGQPQMPRRPKLAKQILTRDEIDLIEHAAIHERDRVVIRVFADCGLRLKELSGLQASDVVRSGLQAYLNVLGKWNRYRAVPVAPALLRRIERLMDYRPQPRSSDAIFLASRRGPDGLYYGLTSDGIYQLLQDAVARSGIGRRVHPHLLRHSWMTEMVRSGMSPIQLSLIAGASPQVIAECYTHLTQDDAYEAMMKALQRGPRR